MTEQAYRVTASEVRQFVERIERLDAEKKGFVGAAKRGDGRS